MVHVICRSVIGRIDLNQIHAVIKVVCVCVCVYKNIITLDTTVKTMQLLLI